MTGPSSDPRVAAFRLLRAVRDGRYADRAAEEELRGLDGRDRGLARELGYGVLRLQARLDTEIAAHSDRPLGRLDPGVLTWLRLGLYQLRELRVPDHAALDETVEGVRRTEGEGPTGFVNAVLRQAARDGDPARHFPDAGEEPAAYLSRHGSHPEWLVRRWLDRWPREDVARLVEHDNRPPEVTGRVLRGTAEEAAAALAEGRGAGDGAVAAKDDGAAAGEGEGAGAGDRGADAGGDVEAPPAIEPLEEWPGSFRLTRGDPAELLRRVPAVIQDPAASAVVDYLGEPERGPVVDACAGPGGKSLLLASRRPPELRQVSADVSLRRIRPLRRAARRLEIDLLAAVADGRRPPLRRAGTLLLDVPCTGTGTLRRRPDARWRLDRDRLRSLAGLQEELLEAGAGLVEPGGLLVYATCSLEPEENERQVDSFLERHPEYSRDSAPPRATGDLPEDTILERGDLRVLPWRHGTDGAYAARLRRREEP